MATLQNKRVVVVGGTSGIGYGVALAALQSFASLVIIASSSQERVEAAVERLKAHKLPGEIRGTVLDAKNSVDVKQFIEGLGVVDHIVWTSGDFPKLTGGSLPYSNIQSAEEGNATFAVRFWGPFVLAKYAKFNPGGSLTLTSECDPGIAGIKPIPGNLLASSITAATEGLTRGLAVDLAPVRVNVVVPGVIDTELFGKVFGDQRDNVVKTFSEKTLLKRSGDPTEIAETYLYLMKCGFITGQSIVVDGGAMLT